MGEGVEVTVDSNIFYIKTMYWHKMSIQKKKSKWHKEEKVTDTQALLFLKEI